MHKTPSYLKGLAETRARAAGDVQRYQKLQVEVSAKLVESQAELEACDRLIRKFDGRLKPALIQPVRAWKGRYGMRGALTDAIVAMLKGESPAAIETTEACLRLQVEFGLDFETPAQQARWRINTVRGRLKVLVSAGLVERLHVAKGGGGNTDGRWRWIAQGATSMDELRSQAAAAGVGVQESVAG